MRLAHRVHNECEYQSVVLHPLLSDVPVVALSCLVDTEVLIVHQYLQGRYLHL